MRNLIKWLGGLMMAVVMCITTAQSFIAEAPLDDCCKKELIASDGCSDKPIEEDCSNKGNPFQNCSCCFHAMISGQSVLLDSKYLHRSVTYSLPVMATIPDIWHAKPWQPPRA